MTDFLFSLMLIAAIVLGAAFALSLATKGAAPAGPAKPRCTEGFVLVYVHGSEYCLPGYRAPKN